MPIAFANPTGQSLYVRFDDASSTAVNLTEGSTLKVGLYTAADAAIVTAGLAAGTYTGRVFVGTAGSQANTDTPAGVVPGFVWSGTAEVAANGNITHVAGTAVTAVGGRLEALAYNARRWYVNPAGSDSNGGHSPTLAKLTIAAAITAASAGDIVEISGGTFNELITLKNGVDLHFDNADLIYTGATAQALIRDNGVAVRSRITGWPKISHRSSAMSGSAATIQLSAASELFVECDYIDNRVASAVGDIIVFYVDHASAVCRCWARRYARSHNYDLSVGNGTLYLDCDTAQSFSQLWENDINVVLRCRVAIATDEEISEGAAGDVYLYADEIYGAVAYTEGFLYIEGARWAGGSGPLVSVASGGTCVLHNVDLTTHPDAPAEQALNTAGTLIFSGSTKFTPVKITGAYTDATAHDANITHIGGAVLNTAAAQIGVNVVNFGGSAGAFASGIPAVNATQIEGFDATNQIDARILAYGALKPTVAGRTLDVTATGGAGLDWSNVENPTTVLDLSGTTIKQPSVLVTTTVTVVDQTHFTLAVGSADNNAYVSQEIVFTDSATPLQKSVRKVTAYTGSTKSVTVDSAPDFTVVTGDTASIIAVIPGATAPTTSEIVTAIDSTSTKLTDLQQRLPAELTASGHMKSDLLEITGDDEAAARLNEVMTGGDPLEVNVTAIDGEQPVSDVLLDAAKDALVAYNLDHLMFVAVTGADVTNNCVVAKLASKSGTAAWSSYNNTTDSLEAVRDGQASLVVTDAQQLLHDTGATISTSTTVLLTPSIGSSHDDSYEDQMVVITEDTNPAYKTVRKCIAYDHTSGVLTLDAAVSFTVPTTGTLDVFATAPGSTAPTASQNANAVLDAVMADHTDSGSVGKAIYDASNIVATGGPVENTPVPDEFTVVVPTRGSTNLAGAHTLYIQPGERILIAVDFVNILHPGDSLSEIILVTESETETLTLDPAGVMGSQAKVWVENVVPGAAYRVEVKVSTRFGLTLEGDALVTAAD